MMEINAKARKLGAEMVKAFGGSPIYNRPLECTIKTDIGDLKAVCTHNLDTTEYLYTVALNPAETATYKSESAALAVGMLLNNGVEIYGFEKR